MRTTSSWENFACYLPEVTPEIIRSTRENNEAASSSNPENDMRDVVKYCFDNNPNDILTWKRILHACVAADEVTVARKILDEHTSKLRLKNKNEYWYKSPIF